MRTILLFKTNKKNVKYGSNKRVHAHLHCRRLDLVRYKTDISEKEVKKLAPRLQA